MQRHSEIIIDSDSSRGRSRFKERGQAGPRSHSCHTNLIGPGSQQRGTNPHIVIDKADQPQSKDDKNKNNTMIAKRGGSLTENQKEKSPSVRRFEEETDDEYVQYMNSVDRYRQNNPNPKPFRPVTARTDAIANPLRKLSADSKDVQQPQPPPVRGQVAAQQPSLMSPPLQAKSKQTTPVRESSEPLLSTARVSKSVPKEVIRITKQTPLKEESQAEILGLVKTNRETGQVEKTKDMDYEDYMNIINRVRITKEQTRVRTEQARLGSMYAQEIKRQEEIQQEEERLHVERQKFEEEKRNPVAQLPPIMTPLSSIMTENNKSDTVLEKGQLDNIEQEQLKISPSTSSVTVSNKPSPFPQKNPSPKQINQNLNNNVEPNKVKVERATPTENKKGRIEEEIEQKRLLEEREKEEKEEEERRLMEAFQKEQILQQKMREEQVLAEQKKLERLREEQIRQEKDREEIRRLEIERLKQIKEDQERLEEERRIQEEQIRQEQLRLDEERRKQEELQMERQAQYQKQHEEMEAKTRAVEEQKRLESERLKKEEINRQTSMSPREKLIYDRMRHQEILREEQLKEEAKIRQVKMIAMQYSYVYVFARFLLINLNATPHQADNF